MTRTIVVRVRNTGRRACRSYRLGVGDAHYRLRIEIRFGDRTPLCGGVIKGPLL